VRLAARAARDAVEDVFRRLRGVARDSVRKSPDMPGSRLMLDSAFLVPRARHRAFEREVERLAKRATKGGCDLSVSGPWPAYHFISRRDEA
jgi:hypothetical protein